MLLLVLIGDKEPPAYKLQLANTLEVPVMVSCQAGDEERMETGVQLGPGTSAGLDLVGLPAECQGFTNDDEWVWAWTLEELKRGIRTYAVRIGETEDERPPLPPPVDEDDRGKAKAKTRDRRSRGKGQGSSGGGQRERDPDPPEDPDTEPPDLPDPPEDTGCTPSSMEKSAMMGTLGTADKQCLEDRLSEASRQTEKVTISRVLLVNAQAAKNDAEYMRLAERHLKDFSQADADICYGYALKLKRRGRYSEAIKWSERALENRDKFNDRQASKWTSNLLQIRAESAYADWKKKDEKYLETRSPMDKISGDKAQSRAKTFAKEWYDFAKESGINEAKAKSLCTSASGTSSYCR